MTGAALLRGDALRLPLADNTVDLIVTSPPYFALRSYRDDGAHYDGQIGSEPTPQAFLAALWAVTAECMRVLKPSGSMFVNLGDKYAGSGGHNNAGVGGAGRGPSAYNKAAGQVPPKSLMLLPEAYRLGCNGMLHTLGGPPPPDGGPFIARSVVIWDKPNGMPEPHTDRVRRSHEDWVHLTKTGDYYAAVDELREAYEAPGARRTIGKVDPSRGDHGDPNKRVDAALTMNPLGKLPGSVWRIPTEPFRAPLYMGLRHRGDMAPTMLTTDLAAQQWAHLNGLEVDGHPANPWPRPTGLHLAAAPDHFAAFPTEWPRRFILGWSPPGICTACGEGRRPVADRESVPTQGPNIMRKFVTERGDGGRPDGRPRTKVMITGEACACPSPDAPTRPSVVLDPFGGTGTTAMVARSLGRFGVSVDLSADYLRLARWRTFTSGHGRKAAARTHRANQGALFDVA